MEPTAKLLVACLVVGMTVAVSGASLAQTATSPPDSTNPPTSSDAAQHFKTGADRLGEGAHQIGEGIKQGAITTWEAIRAGVTSFTARFSGGDSAAKPTQQGRQSP